MKTREIKFRAWDKESEKMFTPEAISNDGKGIIWWQVGREGRKYACELMQFTGLKDKNGKEIYEGDIVIDRNGRKREVAFGKIGYDGRWNGLTGFGFKGGDEFMELEYHADPNDLTVVGNMWENPDLLTPNHNG